MTPRQFLVEEFENVRRVLDETLRFDYGPSHLTRDYYQECLGRLAIIESQIGRVGNEDIGALLTELAKLSMYISFIERSRLGEFSWPFAEEIRTIAKPLLSETLLSGPIAPIIHVISTGEGYQIQFEDISVTVKSRFAIVAFPRSLKHHVLLHSIFGHELGHVALMTTAAGYDLTRKVIAPVASGHLKDVASLTAWLHDAQAPTEVKTELADWHTEKGSAFEFGAYFWERWCTELACDLFGLLLFGPAFVAAHKVILGPVHTPYGVWLGAPTHPPYAVRHKLMSRAMKHLGWDAPVTPTGTPIHDAEAAALKYLMEDPYDDWARLIDDAQVASAVSGLQDVLANFGGHGYNQPDATTVQELVERLINRTPPTMAHITEEGAPQLKRTALAHTLYAGWIYWLGKDQLGIGDPLSFLLVNSLCDQALLQECGIAFAA